MELLAVNKPMILGLVKVQIKSTKLNRVKLRIWRRAGSSNYAMDKSRIWLLWDEEQLQVDTYFKNEQVLIVKCTSKASQVEWYLATIYASNSERDRRWLWDTLR